MKTIMVLGVMVFGATAYAASNTYKVELYQDSVVEGKTLKAGDYKVSLENGNAIIKQGKEVVEVPAHEVEAAKNPSTELIYEDNTDLKEIRVGGSATRIVFEAPSSMHAGS